MNYIKQLQQRIKALEAEREALHKGITELRGHLLSPKFHVDTKIEVRDVENYLNTIQRDAWLTGQNY